MAITIVKKKPVADTAASVTVASPVKPVSAPKTADSLVMLSDFAELIDLYGEEAKEAAKIVAKIKTLTEQLKPFKAIEKELQAKIDALDIDPDEAGSFQYGAGFRVELGKKGAQRVITSMNDVKQEMGDELFMKCATVTLKDIDAYLTKPQRENVTEVVRGSRSYKVAAR